MRVPYLLACWLVLSCLLVSDEVRNLYLYEYVIGAERIGTAVATRICCAMGNSRSAERLVPRWSSCDIAICVSSTPALQCFSKNWGLPIVRGSKRPL